MVNRYQHIDLSQVGERVSNYLQYAPHYPVEILNVLRQDFGLNENDTIADIGAGLGYLSNLFINEAKQLYILEQDEDYLDILQQVYGQFEHTRIIQNSAEKTDIPYEAIDLILVGHAFHQFAPKPTKEEFLRIIKPNGLVCLIWHQRNIEKGFQADYETVLQQYIPNYKNLAETHINLKSIDNFFDPYPFQFQKFPNFLVYDINGLKGHFLSSNLITNEEEGIKKSILKELEIIFDRHEQFGKIRFDYNTLVFIGKIK